MGMYSVSYVRSLESQLSNFQDDPGEPISNQTVNQPHSGSPSRQILEQPINHNGLNHGGLATQDAPEQLGMTYLAPLYTPNNMLYDLDLLQQEDNLFSISHIPPVSHRDTTTSPVAASDTTVPVQSLSQATAPTVAEVSINEGACFFQTYFETVHPRYPFLDVEECSRAYQDWKSGDIFISSGTAWSSYLVKMVCLCNPTLGSPLTFVDFCQWLHPATGPVGLYHTATTPRLDASSSSRSEYHDRFHLQTIDPTTGDAVVCYPCATR